MKNILPVGIKARDESLLDKCSIEIKGNHNCIIIPNITSVKNFLCSDFSYLIDNKYKHINEEYKCNRDKKLGKVYWNKIIDNKETSSFVLLANIVCYNESKKYRKINYVALTSGLMKIKNKADSIKINEPNINISIKMPLIVKSKTGANWFFISEILADIYDQNNKLEVYKK